MQVWTETKRKEDRRIPSRITPPKDVTAFNSPQFPCTKEQYDSIWWTTTTGQTPAPNWAKLPHSSITLQSAIDIHTATAKLPAHRFRGYDHEIHLPVDDCIYKRDLILTAFEHRSDFFLKIREQFQYPNGDVEVGIVNIGWDRVEKLLSKLEEISEIHLPPAKEVLYTNDGIYISKRMDDMKREINYYVDVTHETIGEQGWTRMVHITMENPPPDSDIIGDIAFPWHFLPKVISTFHKLLDNQHRIHQQQHYRF